MNLTNQILAFINNKSLKSMRKEEGYIGLIEFIRSYNKNYPIQIKDKEKSRELNFSDFNELTLWEIVSLRLTNPVYCIYNKNKTKVRIVSSSGYLGNWLFDIKDMSSYYKAELIGERDMFELNVEHEIVKYAKEYFPNIFIKGYYD